MDSSLYNFDFTICSHNSDFEPRYRDIIKQYIIDRFGQDNVCTVGTYGTYKSRGVLLDLSRIHNVPLQEALHITKNVMTSDCDSMNLDQIINEFELVKNYVDRHPFIKESFDVINKQIKNISKHAAGVIISDRNLQENIALMQRDGNIFSAWQEGSDFHELSSLGFIKFDILGLNNLSVIKDCIDLIKQRHNIELDFYNWPDMDDKKSFELASNAESLGVFQFESRIAKDILKKVGVKSFMDLSHISSVLRPGPLRAGVADIFAKRKNGEEEYNIPEVLKDILDETCGVLIYQEQIMLIAQKIGGFNQAESNDFRKALVKYGKGESVEAERFSKALSYKDKFVENACKFITKEEVDDLWEKIISFIAYGFNKCLTGDTLIYRSNGNENCKKEISIKELYNRKLEKSWAGDKLRRGNWPKIQCAYEDNKVRLNDIVNIYENGINDVYEIKTSTNKKIKATLNHRFLMSNNEYKCVYDIKIGDSIYIFDDINKKRWQKGKELDIDTITEIKYYGKEMTYDIEMKDPHHNFIANGFVSHNSHGVAYAYISYIQFYLKAHYFVEFIAALLNNTSRGKETNQRESYLKMYINYSRENNVDVLNPDINISQSNFSIINEKTISFGLDHVKNMGKEYDEIIKNRPYKDFYDFFKKINSEFNQKESDNFFVKKVINTEKNVAKSKVNKLKVESLIYSGAFDAFGNRNELVKIYNEQINKNKKYEYIELNESELIEKEIDMLQLCLSKSILDENFIKYMKANKCNTPSYIHDNELELCNVGGLLSKIREKQIKSGKRVGTKYKQIDIQDDFNIITISFFNEADCDYIMKKNIDLNIF